VFCELEGSGRVLLENELALCIADAYPVSEGHSLVIPRRNVADGMALPQPEWNALVEQREQPNKATTMDRVPSKDWAPPPVPLYCPQYSSTSPDLLGQQCDDTAAPGGHSGSGGGRSSLLGEFS
jgi:hypothetical protein